MNKAKVARKEFNHENNTNEMTTQHSDNNRRENVSPGDEKY